MTRGSGTYNSLDTDDVVDSHFECHIPIPDVIPMSFMTWKWELVKWS